MPSLIEDLRHLITYATQVITSIETDSFGEGNEIANLTDTARGVFECLHWLERHKRPEGHP
ncbi:hypothetical protein [Actinokineospora sp. NBRC 105648]|uniref:hypothetical protein n=1 Tax=Actinokineospora sp. NBRC 105648 TaxID=3032206 RepID=UPI002556531C|nr:hypothetical protein [Actinokineospora sp. NBRC 105648]